MTGPAGRTQRDDLLDALVAIFLAEGFRSLTLAELAARLRCSKTTLYALGQSKERVTVNVVRHFFRRAAGQIEDEVAGVSRPAERLATYVGAIGRALDVASPAFMADLGAHDAAREVYRRRTAEASDRVRELITDGVEAGEFRQVSAALVADVTTQMMQRIASGALRTATGLGDAEAYAELAFLVLDGVRTSRAAAAVPAGHRP